MLRQLLASWLLVVLTAGSARAQEQTPPGNPAPAQTPPAARIDTSKLPELCVAGKTSSEPNAVVYEGDVTCQLPDGARVYGDVIKFIQETDGARIEGEGNVVFCQLAPWQFDYKGVLPYEADVSENELSAGTRTLEHGFPLPLLA